MLTDKSEWTFSKGLPAAKTYFYQPAIKTLPFG
jgi:hypothetical protein